MEQFEEIKEEITTIEAVPEDKEDFIKYLRAIGINDVLEDVTLEHTRKRIEVLLALAEEGKDKKLVTNKKQLKSLLEKLKGEKDKRAAMRALREIYRDYEDSCSEECGSYLEQKVLDKKIKHALREYKKYETFKKHEERIAEKWIKELSK